MTKRRERATAALGLVAVAFLAVTLVLRLDEPFDSSLGGTTSAAYYGRAARAFDEFGFMRLKLQPPLFVQRRSLATLFPYLNHPPFPHLVTATSYARLGRDERALRLPILLLLAVTVAATAWAAGSRPAAFLAIAFLATTPLIIQYGDMVDAPSFSLATLALAWSTWERHRRRRSRVSLSLWILVGGAAGLADWFGYLLVPALWLDLALRRDDARPWRLAFAAGLPFGLALLIYLGWLAWVVDSLALWRTQVTTLLGVVAVDGSPAVDASFWIDSMTRWIGRGFGVPLLIAAALGAAIGSSSPARRAGLVLTLAGALPSVVFRDRAAVHEFWILQAAPGLALLAAAFGQRVIAAARGRVAVSAVVIIAASVLVAGAIGGRRLHASYATDVYRDQGRDLNLYTGPDDVVLVPTSLSPMSFYANAAIVPDVRTKAVFVAVIRSLNENRFTTDHLWLLWPQYAGVVEELGGVLDFRLSARTIDFGPGNTAALIELDFARAAAW